ncbi:MULTISPECIES: hypothetical protein [Parachlamydia]|jgi:hypothetical protein|uniref:Uncharacterized protein n=2 Tax=Parachlamydia acanthamoebae TaxID=83552 RepID=F8KV22_PARAV|nr:hypothetical protein [Parachlamydia acanthamoebae]CCB85094.1 hypothetical protein, putative type III secreted [Parachlamydia acanthamoebae UV-7]
MMNTKSLMMLKVLLNRYHEKKMKEFIDCLPSENVQAILSTQTEASAPEAVLWAYENKIGQVHYSWLVPILKKIPIEEAAWIMSALPVAIVSKLKKVCHISPLEVELSAPAKEFALHYLWKQIEQPDVMPIEFLPQTSLSFLLQTSREDLLEIIDLLSIYDLADKVRQIVDKNRLKNIYGSLKPIELQFLRFCLNKQEKLAISPLNLADWNGDSQQLRQKLHRRGLSRLGHALVGESADFKWHFLRKFDVARAAVLQHCSEKQDTSKVTAILIQQLLGLVNFRNKKDNREQ